MDRFDELELELENLSDMYDDSDFDEKYRIQREIDRILCEMDTYDDHWLPETSDVNVNEL